MEYFMLSLSNRNRTHCCPVGHIAVIGLLALSIVEAVDNHPDREAEKPVDGTHPLGIPSCQIVIDCDHVDTLAAQGIQVDGQGCGKGLAFPCGHLGDLPFVDTAPPTSWASKWRMPTVLCATSSRLQRPRAAELQILAVGKALLQLRRYSSKLAVGKPLQSFLYPADRLHEGLYTLQLPLILCPTIFFSKFPIMVDDCTTAG